VAALVPPGSATYDAVLSSQRPPSVAEKAAIVSTARDTLADPGRSRSAEIRTS